MIFITFFSACFYGDGWTEQRSWNVIFMFSCIPALHARSRSEECKLQSSLKNIWIWIWFLLFPGSPEEEGPPRWADGMLFQRHLIVPEENMLQLSCPARGYPPPTIGWFRDSIFLDAILTASNADVSNIVMMSWHGNAFHYRINGLLTDNSLTKGQ